MQRLGRTQPQLRAAFVEQRQLQKVTRRIGFETGSQSVHTVSPQNQVMTLY